MSQIAIVEAFADLEDCRRQAGKRHKQSLCLALFTLGEDGWKSGVYSDWRLVKSLP